MTKHGEIFRRNRHRFFPLSIWKSILSLLVNFFLLTACSPVTISTGIPNILDPKGPGAETIADDWWFMFILGSAVFLVVTGLFLYVLSTRKSKEENAEVLHTPSDGRSWIWWGGIIIPVIILTITLISSLRALAALASPAIQPEITIEVVGHQWWWEVHYPDEEFATANELRIPVGRPVQIQLTSKDVIHSFWVPELHGKLDMNPGKTNTMWIQADTPGVYRGFCAEFCGLQHAKMQFVVIAESLEDYQAWVSAQRLPAPEPENERIRSGQQVFLGSSCVYCHTVRGTNATATVGPDLTHFASRQTLAAGILENNRGNLAGWILDPQHIKPGNRMPATELSPEELQAMLDYLDILR